MGADNRPLDGQLYAWSTAGRAYVINPETGVATAKNAGATLVSSIQPVVAANCANTERLAGECAFVLAPNVSSNNILRALLNNGGTSSWVSFDATGNGDITGFDVDTTRRGGRRPLRAWSVSRSSTETATL